ncbi:hypothetical protein [Erythrobacter sp.]|uniref:hypothetical protein n=1 Tax=Erythrobacter sp. TaxID=1042 RepID=UPI001B00980D|nr:hypothetical protein [Erythrobacter sp.]MBO6527791.1 hypothetical protein [Erythrobacter sp.]MBO6531259.1 hypothetical protein [Erythrobacter sp.]
MSSAENILSDHEWFPHEYDPNSDKLAFVRIASAARKQLAFLADFRPLLDGDRIWLDADLVRSIRVQSPKVAFVFHSAFCRSTLLIKALDEFDGVIGLSEPQIFNNLQAHSADARAQSLIGPVLSLLGRPGPDASAVIVKPSNFANGLISRMLSSDAAGEALLLYGSLRDFLVSIVKKGLQGRIWARKQLLHNRQTIPIALEMDERAYYELTDLQTAALAWLLHLGQFHHLARTGGDRIATFQSTDFAQQPQAALEEIARFFQLDVDPTEARTVAEGEIFSRHSKKGGDYSRISAQESRNAMSKVTEDEIDQIVYWIDVISAQLGITLPLSRKLHADQSRAGSRERQ